jgi:chromatin structure-remodeling complex protein RSC7
MTDGKWVTDDYYEDECLAKCAENGFTPYAPVQEEEIAAATHGVAGIRGDREREQLIAISKTNALSPFYTLGGPSTHFGGAGIDPWSDGGYGNKRARLRGAGVTAEDWMYKTALESRGIDELLKGYREERVGLLEGKDLNGWVWNTEERTDRPSKPEITGGESPNIKSSGLKPPTMDRQRSGLSREVTFEPEPTVFEHERNRGEGEEYKDWVNQEYDNSMEMIKEVDEPNGANTSALTSLSEIVMSTTKDEIRVETEQEAMERRAKYSYGAGGWFHGSIKAAYEVCLFLSNPAFIVFLSYRVPPLMQSRIRY